MGSVKYGYGLPLSLPLNGMHCSLYVTLSVLLQVTLILEHLWYALTVYT